VGLLLSPTVAERQKVREAAAIRGQSMAAFALAAALAEAERVLRERASEAAEALRAAEPDGPQQAGPPSREGGSAADAAAPKGKGRKRQGG
jgi:hypothetical protein